jgi:hypothetical protein
MTFEEAAAAAWDFVRPKLLDLHKEQGAAGVWTHGFRSGWGSGLRADLRVKRMEWRKGYCDERVTIEQASNTDLFQVRQFEGKVWLDHRQTAKEFPTVEAAKAAAQSIFDEAIRSYLEAAP